jgi:hypothetical protein
MQNYDRTVHADIVLTPVCQIGSLVPAASGIIQEIWTPSHSLLNEDALGKLSMFSMQVVVADHPQEYPRKGDRFIMQVLIKAGYADDTLI